MHKKNVLHSPRLTELKKKKRTIFIRKIIVFLVFFILIIAGLSFLSKIQRLNIADIKIEGNNVTETDAIKTSIENKISGKYVWLFSKSNVLFYPKNSIKNDLENTFKRLHNIEISMTSGQTLTVSVSERSPEYTWCGLKPPEDNTPETCYFLDKIGYIFDEAPYFSGDVYFKFYGKTSSGEENPAGSYIAKEYVEKLIVFKDVLTKMNFKPVSLYFDGSDDIKISLAKVKAMNKGPEIMFKKDADFQKIAENLKAALNTEPLLSKFKNEYANLEYIDLRFGNKVYYKFR